MKIGNTAGVPSGIGEIGAPAAVPDSANKSRVAKSGSGNTNVPGSTSATVKLSRTATELLGAAVDDSFDQTKVEQVRQSISDGSYKINHEVIADKLIANAKELLGKVAPQR